MFFFDHNEIGLLFPQLLVWNILAFTYFILRYIMGSFLLYFQYVIKNPNTFMSKYYIEFILIESSE